MLVSDHSEITGHVTFYAENHQKFMNDQKYKKYFHQKCFFMSNFVFDGNNDIEYNYIGLIFAKRKERRK